jgi:hypothetical protein
MRNKAASALLFVLFLSSALMAQSNCGKFEKIIGENHFYLVVEKAGLCMGSLWPMQKLPCEVLSRI